MIRPLYLGAETRAVALDGPALRIAAEGRADARVPLRMLSRVVSRTAVEWSTSALVACLTAGVPVALVGTDGAAIGLCLPTARRSADLARRLDALEREPGGTEAFRNWARAEERRAMLAVLGRPEPGAAVDARPETLRRMVLAAADVGPDRAAAMLRALEGMLAAHLAGLLLGAGLPHRRAAPAPPGRLDLFGACLGAARWELVPALERAAAHRRAQPRAWDTPRQRARRLARRYEATAPRIAASMRRRLRRLDEWLWEREP
ncbi:MAG: CRISPR-associated endonuclease Cas1 [Rhodospirillaceae bacterium]|nr:CRISPR-associated endonuclease Cas1 [Rhodospirillaceae bacterium]